MRVIYSLLWAILLPLAFLYLLWRSRRQPAYRRHWRERLGFAPRLDGAPVIWLHAVSVGETRAAAPLLRALMARHPDHRILLTHTTPTGRETGAELFGSRVVQAYLPYDLPGLIDRFLDRTRPRLAIFMETEIWPNTYAACAARGIPAYLVNARLSERSARGYQRFRALMGPALASLAAVAAQGEADAARLRALGAGRVEVCGNLKFDVDIPANARAAGQALRADLGERFVLLCASTREGEEALLLDALARVGAKGGVLLIVPRHPQRFDEVAEAIRKRGLSFARRSAGAGVDRAIQVFLGDSMGEMATYYAACDVAFIGGSLLPWGGQNLIEACAAGKPVLIGPHTWNFADASEQALQAGAAMRVTDAADLGARAEWLRDHPEECTRMGQAGEQFAAGHRGASQRILAVIEGESGGPASAVRVD